MIRAFRITNFRGIKEMSAKLAPGGAVIKGRNGGGKTSAIGALRAALEARDIAPDAIRNGADESSIEVDLEHYTVQRIIRANGKSSLSIVNAEGDRKPSPVRWLKDLIGEGGLDPLALFIATPRDRRALILSALPVKLTNECLTRWLPQDIAEQFGHELDEIDLDATHGLDAVHRVHQIMYEARKSANAVAADLEKKVTVESERLAAKRQCIPDGTPVVTEASGIVEAARTALADVKARYEQATRAARATQSARARITEMEYQAQEHDARATARDRSDADLAAAHAKLDAAATHRAELRQQLEAAEREYDDAVRETNAIVDARTAATGHRKTAAQARAHAEELTATLTATAVVMPSDDEIADADAAHTEALNVFEAAKTADALNREFRDLEALRKTQTQVVERAQKLTAVVDFLRVSAPADLAGDVGIKGLSIDGDDVLLDGVNIEHVSGREKIRLAVEIAKRANSKAKLIICDGLEAIDPDQWEDFKRFATADNWQLIGTRVDRGEPVVELIDGEQSAEAAE